MYVSVRDRTAAATATARRQREYYHRQQMIRPVGRVCEFPECITVLSRYNETPWCSLHESPYK